jgi:[CysO sulfur-carrier protein]-S-L-cysteine hydrolase
MAWNDRYPFYPVYKFASGANRQLTQSKKYVNYFAGGPMEQSAITLSSDLLNAMIEHARRELPNECCGVLIGQQGVFERVIPVTSVHPAPDAYFMSPEEQVEIFTELGEGSGSLLGIYHSHPKGPVSPSGMDISLAFHPDAVYFIVSLKNRKHPEVRAFRIEKQVVNEIPINEAG